MYLNTLGRLSNYYFIFTNMTNKQNRAFEIRVLRQRTKKKGNVKILMEGGTGFITLKKHYYAPSHGALVVLINQSISHYKIELQNVQM